MVAEVVDFGTPCFGALTIDPINGICQCFMLLDCGSAARWEGDSGGSLQQALWEDS